MAGARAERSVDPVGTARTCDAVAGGEGRRAGTAARRGVVEVSEVTRTGALVRTAPFLAGRASPRPHTRTPQGRPSVRTRPLHPGEYAVGTRVILREARKPVRGHDVPVAPGP